MSTFFGFDGILNSLFPVIFLIMFFCAFGMILYTIVKGISTWNKNNNSPRLTVWAKVVAKRTSISHNQHANPDGNGFDMTTSTFYYVTFQVESGDRMELNVSGSEYGMLAEGDIGELSFQGTRYLGFERK